MLALLFLSPSPETFFPWAECGMALAMTVLLICLNRYRVALRVRRN
ncbi:MAG: hypothetical protein SFU56_07825 [Capsulimonadales bacterium]|nr:hypothetical protein [Capsulimonadales bacterium]